MKNDIRPDALDVEKLFFELETVSTEEIDAAEDEYAWAGTKATGYALPELGPFLCIHCEHAQEYGTVCDHPKVMADPDVPKTEDGKAKIKPGACCNYYHPVREK